MTTAAWGELDGLAYEYALICNHCTDSVETRELVDAFGFLLRHRRHNTYTRWECIGRGFPPTFTAKQADSLKMLSGFATNEAYHLRYCLTMYCSDCGVFDFPCAADALDHLLNETLEDHEAYLRRWKSAS